MQSFIPTILLATTPKQSAIRYIGIACMVWIAILDVRAWSDYMMLRVFIAGQTFMAVPQAAHLLLINPLDVNDLVREQPDRTKSLAGRLRYALDVVCLPRGVGTPRQAKGIPPFPSYPPLVSRGAFLLRQSLVLAWQYAVLDLVQFAGRLQATEPPAEVVFTYPEWNVSLDKWAERIITHCITWILVSRLIIDSRYRVISIIAVGLGLDSPRNWPPAFGTMADVYTIRKFWG
jgi:hypothetical protein